MSSGESRYPLLADFFDNSELEVETNYLGAASPDDIFSILEALESSEFDPLTSLDHETSNLGPKEGEAEGAKRLVSQKSTSSFSSAAPVEESEMELEAAAAANESSPKTKRQKLSTGEEGNLDGQQKISHITVERNRRKQMNDNLVVLRSIMPSFYVKRGDQASIVGGVVDYISELQQVLQSLEAKKRRKVYSEVLSPRFVVSSPRLTSSPLSPRKPPLSPRLVPTTSSLPISPRTPTPTSPYKHHRLHQLSDPAMPAAALLKPSPSSSPSIDHMSCGNELVANSKSAIADVEVKFSGPNVLLKTTSPRIPGQAVKIISALEEHLSLEILNVSLNTIDQTMLNSFTIKIGTECRLSAEELAHQIQQTFC